MNHETSTWKNKDWHRTSIYMIWIKKNNNWVTNRKWMDIYF